MTVLSSAHSVVSALCFKYNALHLWSPLLCWINPYLAAMSTLDSPGPLVTRADIMTS